MYIVRRKPPHRLQNGGMQKDTETKLHTKKTKAGDEMHSTETDSTQIEGTGDVQSKLHTKLRGKPTITAPRNTSTQITNKHPENYYFYVLHYYFRRKDEGL